MRSWYRCRWLGPAIALTLVVGLVAGCGGSGPPTTNSSGSDHASDDGGESSAAGNSSGSGNSQSGGNSQGGDTSSDEELAWVPFGPADPTIPTPSWPAYRAFANGDCGALQAYLGTSDGASLGDFGKAMVAVCEAAVEGRQDRWEAAAAALAAADPSSLANDCLAGVVKDLLDRALAWHQRYPGRKPAVRFQRLDGQTECGRQANGDSSSETTTDTETTSSTEPPATETTPDTQPTDTETTTETTS